MTAELFPRCPECGGEVRLLGGTGRTRHVLPGVHLPIPDDFGIPTCTRCGEESMTLEVSEQLDRMITEKLWFPIQHVDYGRRRYGEHVRLWVVRAVVERFTQQIVYNHDQSLDRLAERGGLSPKELLSAVRGEWRFEACRDKTLTHERVCAELSAHGVVVYTTAERELLDRETWSEP